MNTSNYFGSKDRNLFYAFGALILGLLGFSAYSNADRECDIEDPTEIGESLTKREKIKVMEENFFRLISSPNICEKKEGSSTQNQNSVISNSRGSNSDMSLSSSQLDSISNENEFNGKGLQETLTLTLNSTEEAKKEEFANDNGQNAIIPNGEVHQRLEAKDNTEELRRRLKERAEKEEDAEVKRKLMEKYEELSQK